MTKNDIFDKVHEIFKDIFEDEDLLITNDTSSDSIEDWDSLNHINLVSAIEQEFKIKFTLNEIFALKNVGDMIDLMSVKID